ncbi:MAG: uracil-DNA glycosylase [Bacteroidota bacterium]
MRTYSDTNALSAAAQACTRCPRMAGRRRVLSANNGSLQPRALLIGEAPGARGAERTGMPFFGDTSGDNLEQLMAAAGLSRQSVFISNAVLCNPQTPTGANGKPTARELTKCSGFLSATIELLAAPVIVTIGRVALDALSRLVKHEYKLKTHAGELLDWNGRCLFPVYHMSPLGLLHRKWDAQMADWQRLGELLNTIAC